MYIFFQIVNKVVAHTEPDINLHSSLLVIFLQLKTLSFITVVFPFSGFASYFQILRILLKPSHFKLIL